MAWIVAFDAKTGRPLEAYDTDNSCGLRHTYDLCGGCDMCLLRQHEYYCDIRMKTYDTKHGADSAFIVDVFLHPEESK